MRPPITSNNGHAVATILAELEKMSTEKVENRKVYIIVRFNHDYLMWSSLIPTLVLPKNVIIDADNDRHVTTDMHGNQFIVQCIDAEVDWDSHPTIIIMTGFCDTGTISYTLQKCKQTKSRLIAKNRFMPNGGNDEQPKC